jgi:hypothetical protein
VGGLRSVPALWRLPNRDLLMTGELEIVHARNVVESAAKGVGVCYGKGFKGCLLKLDRLGVNCVR